MTNTPSTMESIGQGTPTARLDRLPILGKHVIWILILALGYMIETFDNGVFSFVAPSIMAEWGLTVGQVGFVVSAVFIGMFVGAVVGGKLSDRLGRKPVLIYSSIFYSAASLLTALAPNFEVLFLGRVLTGIGVQAATGVIMVYITEMFPRIARGRFVTIMTFGGYVIAPLTSILVLALAPIGIGSWRIAFAIGAVGVVVAAVVALCMPETVRWLVTHGKAERAERLVAEMELQALRKGPLGPIETEPPPAKAGRLSDLVSRQYRRRFISFAISFALLIYCLYGFGAFVPTVLVSRGLDRSEAVGLVGVMSLGCLLGPALLFFVADRIERKTALLISGLISAVAVIVFGFATDTTVAAVSGFIVYAGTCAMTTSIYTYLPEAFPTAIRGVGAGTVNGIGRIAGVVSGATVAAMLGSLGSGPTFLIVGTGFVLMGVIVHIFGPRSTGRSLEDISHG
ncbi:MFS transporter [Pseudarthrobacter sp. SL88]|uniref:MFS transporter n=1 Tax=Pseudarthrobacter sp. SL88 TaxID=2994666 RepID=UPI0022745A0B|nr:MFS transporter [Pseudarthrobacter sp. SL88]MCY1676509.1 MFS transporter [Pseudarthrobacter sp. SL88]